MAGAFGISTNTREVLSLDCRLASYFDLKEAWVDVAGTTINKLVTDDKENLQFIGRITFVHKIMQMKMKMMNGG